MCVYIRMYNVFQDSIICSLITMFKVSDIPHTSFSAKRCPEYEENPSSLTTGPLWITNK